jgi:hypothetical protein
MCELKKVIHYCTTLAIKPTRDILIISISEQKLFHFINGQRVVHYLISTSEQPPSCTENSFGTPLGLHCIAQKIGTNTPYGGVFHERIYTNKCFFELPGQEQNENLITSRILWLQGLEPYKNQGVGCDSYDRKIYIHGTNKEHSIGMPQSSGCILLKNDDMIALYNSVEESSLVWINA